MDVTPFGISTLRCESPMTGYSPVLWINNGNAILGCNRGIVSIWGKDGRLLQQLSHKKSGVIDITVCTTSSSVDEIYLTKVYWDLKSTSITAFPKAHRTTHYFAIIGSDTDMASRTSIKIWRCTSALVRGQNTSHSSSC